MGATASKLGRRRTNGSGILSGGSVQVGGESIYYEASGLAEDRCTVLFLHESGGSSATWHGQLVGLAQGARSLVPDLSGHGKSEGSGFSSITDYRQAVLGFLDALAIRWPVVLAGVCLGSAVAIDVALHAPERVAGLVLSGVSEGGRACDGTRRAAAHGEAPESFVEQLFGENASRRLVMERLQRWRLTSPVVRHGDLTALSGYPMVESLRAVTHPVLLFAGEQDPIASPGVAREITAGMFDAHVAVIPRAGCLAMVEQPAHFNREMSAFLGELEPVRPILPEESRQRGGYRRF